MLGSNNGELLLVEEGDELKVWVSVVRDFSLRIGEKKLLSSLPFVVRRVHQTEAKIRQKKIPTILARLERE